MIKNKEFQNLMKSYNVNIQGVIRRFMSLNQADIDDVQQEVYVKAWKNLSKFRGETELWFWIRKITVNTCINHLNSGKKHQNNISDDDLLKQIPAKSLCPERKIIKLERQKLIMSKINKLKPKFKEVIILHDIDEFTYEEIAEKLKCPIGTVKSRLFNARKILAVELSEILN